MADLYDISEEEQVQLLAEAVIYDYGLNRDQAKALRWVVVEGNNLYLTGKAGTGKSRVGAAIRECLAALKRGFAAVAVQNTTLPSIQGTTIHSFFQIGPDDTLEEMVPLASDSPKRGLIRDAQVIFFEEVSLVSSRLLEMVDARIRGVMNSDEPFAGKQLVFCGDFGQLPPVGGAPVMEGDLWRRVIDSNPFCYMRLTEVFRQKDRVMVELLDRVRAGVVTDQDKELYASLVSKPVPDSALRVFATNQLVRAYNEVAVRKLAASGAETHTYSALGWFTSHGGQYALDKLVKDTGTIPPLVTLSVGTKVVCKVNYMTSGPYERRIYNGLLMTVVGFTTSEPPSFGGTLPSNCEPPMPGRGHVEGPGVVCVVDGTGDRYVFGVHSWTATRRVPGTLAPLITAVRRQIPLVPFYASTGHGLQGASVDELAVSPEGTSNTPGLIYVMMSRATSLAGLHFVRSKDCARMPEAAAVKNTVAQIVGGILGNAVEANTEYEHRMALALAALESDSSESESGSGSESDESESGSGSDSEPPAKRTRKN